MSPLRLNGSTSGNVTLDAPAVAANNTLTLPTTTNGSLVALDSSGRLGIGTTSVGNRLVVAQPVSTTFGNAGTYIGIGDTENGSGSYRLIGFGYKASSGNEYPAVIGYTETDNGGNTKGALVFGTRDVTTNTAPTERMRITAAGALSYSPCSGADLVGTEACGFVGDGVFGPIYKTKTALTSLKWAAQFHNGNGQVGSISTNGSATSFTTSSDYRLKENVAPITGATARILQLKPSRFNFIVDPDKTVDGFLAHEAQEVIPGCATGIKDEVDADGNPIYQGIDQSKLVPLLTAALQEAIAKIESLEARLTALEVTP